MSKKGKGQLLILVLGVMGMGMIVIGPLLAYVDLSLRLSTQSTLKNSAYYAAEAGIQMAIGDLYQAQDIITKSPYNGTMNDYNFSTTVTNGSGASQQQTESSAYFDPGITMYMRPMLLANTSSYSFVATKGKAVKINWTGYASGPDKEDKQPYDFVLGNTERLNTTIGLYYPNGSLVPGAYKIPTAQEVYASDEARIVSNTLLVPGANISGGVYTVKFSNGANRSTPATASYACSQFFSADADAEWFTFNGSITKNCSNFVDNGSSGGTAGNITILAINEDNGDRASGGWGGRKDVNTFSFFCDYVALSVTSNVTGNITTNTYTYSGVTPAGTGNNRSYTGAVTVGGTGSDKGKPGSTTYHSPGWYGGGYYNWQNIDYYANYVTQRINASATELDAGNYSRISSPDGNRMLSAVPNVSRNNSCLWNVFNIPEGRTEINRSKISKIEVHWEGYQTKAANYSNWWGDEDNRDDDELYLLLWNYRDTVSPTAKYHILERKQVDGGFTWVKILQGGYADYLITSTSSRDGKDAITITCYIRQTPGPSMWWEEQSLEILSWNVHIHGD